MQAQTESATNTNTVRLEHLIIDNSVTNAVVVSENAFDASLIEGQEVAAKNGTRQGAKPAASLDTVKTGQIRFGQIIPCLLPTPSGTGYFEQRAALLEEIRNLRFPSAFAVSRLKAEYMHDAATENGKQIVGAMRIVGPPSGKISAAGLRVWCEFVGVPGSAISYEYGTLGYQDFRFGIIYGADGVRGTADDTIITSGDGSTMVDEIIFVGLGQSLNNTQAQVAGAFAASKIYTVKWFAQVREPNTEFTPPEGDFSNLSVTLDQNEGAPAPTIVGRSVKNTSNFPWEVWSAPKVTGPYTWVGGSIPPGASLPTTNPGETIFYRFSRP